MLNREGQLLLSWRRTNGLEEVHMVSQEQTVPEGLQEDTKSRWVGLHVSEDFQVQSTAWTQCF